MEAIFSRALPAAVLLVALAAPAGFADERVTPYGDYCRDCGRYGFCKGPIPRREAVAALAHYYEQRGYAISSLVHRGRFIEAEISKNRVVVDRVLFDRNTGRVRSLY